MPLDLKGFPELVQHEVCEMLDINPTELSKLGGFDVFDAWLRYNGIIGYTHRIINTLDAIREAEALDEWSVTNPGETLPEKVGSAAPTSNTTRLNKMKYKATLTVFLEANEADYNALREDRGLLAETVVEDENAVADIVVANEDELPAESDISDWTGSFAADDSVEESTTDSESERTAA